VTSADPTTTLRPTGRGRAQWRLVAAGGAALVFVLGAAITMAASPEPSTSPSPDPTAVPGGFGPRGMGKGFIDGLGEFAGRHGGIAGGRISITAIDGSSVSLETVDGWTRTISVGDSTSITKDGQTIALSDLSVGDNVRIRQTVEDDTWTVTAIEVVVPIVVGQVTATDGDSLTLQQPDGSSATVHVDGSTTYTVAGESGKALADVEVGMVVVASGELNDDGSLDASSVRAGSIWQGLGRGGRGHGPWSGNGPWSGDPAPTASPDASTDEG
jgi:hypothetical protein